MIDTIEKLVNYTIEKSNILPQLKERILIKSPGYNSSEIKKIKKKLSNISEVFIDVIELVRLDGISINYFNFSSLNESYIAKLDALNSKKSGYWDLLKNNSLYQIATFETDLICHVNQDGLLKKGEIVIIREDDEEFSPKSLAPDFKTFMLSVINLDKILSDSDEDINEDLNKLKQVLEAFKLNIEQQKEWMDIGEYVLEE